ncbi:MAG: hypothetical protein ACD_78C00259G0001 [uncultured bacterium (gcode 4)]|uniref:Uncharacterized protein n=1 Tax=uncultured bacterium (gcode 4) TaxID=1234023 RepID=K1XHK7_9BACT|nr:MAG: hypothetical protein ACD_78C00259G0001 [uncultured bacterium (gcode 4)]
MSKFLAIAIVASFTLVSCSLTGTPEVAPETPVDVVAPVEAPVDVVAPEAPATPEVVAPVEAPVAPEATAPESATPVAPAADVAAPAVQ